MDIQNEFKKSYLVQKHTYQVKIPSNERMLTCRRAIRIQAGRYKFILEKAQERPYRSP